MRKLLLYFSLFIFNFPFCKAQDTLVYKGGQKEVVKVVSFGDKVIYILPNGTTQSVSQSKLAYIKYKDGTRYSIEQNEINQNSYDKPDQRNNQPIIINAGIGFSTMVLAVIAFYPGDFIGPGAGTFITQSPAYNGTADYEFSKGFTIGAGAAYQWVTDNPYAPPINNVSETWAVEKITRYNLSLRLLYQFIKIKEVDFYLGIRGGESIWTDQMVSNNPPNQYVTPVQPTFVSSVSHLSFQSFLGFRAYPVYNIGLHFESGLGTPYILEGGITFRFKTRKGDSE